MQPDPKPTRERGRLPTVEELGGECQVCGGTRNVERMHLVRGAHKEDRVDLIMLGCGHYGRCRVHPRLDQGDQLAAIAVRAAMTDRQQRAVLEARGLGWFEAHYPDPKERTDDAPRAA